MDCTARFFVNPGAARLDPRVRNLADRLAAAVKDKHFEAAISTMRSVMPTMGPSSMLPCSETISAFTPRSAYQALAMRGYLVATRSDPRRA